MYGRMEKKKEKTEEKLFQSHALAPTRFMRGGGAASANSFFFARSVQIGHKDAAQNFVGW